MEKPPSAFKQYRTIKHIVYDQLRNLIVTGQYLPGYRLITGHLAEQMGVSPTPVREALHSLEVEGLVKFHPYHGAEVTQLSVNEIIEIYHIRAALESLVTRLATPNLAAADFKQIAFLLEEMEQAAQENSSERILEANREFHLIIWKSSKSPRLHELLENYYDASQRFRYVSITVPGRMDQICQEHRQIAKALMEGNADLAGKFAGDQLERTASYLLGSIKIRQDVNF
jgi:DNA-binding GntR family transcriptional regulator